VRGLPVASDLLLTRNRFHARDYNTEDQPTDPISAAAISLVTSASDIGLAIADMPREMFKSRPKASDRAASGSSTPENGSQQLVASGSGANSASASTIDVSSISSVPVDGSQSSATRTLSSVGTELSPEPTRSAADSASQSTLAGASGSHSSGREHARSPSASTRPSGRRRDSSPIGAGINAAVGAGKSVGRVVSTGVQSPMNFCLGLAKGFRNVPKLYNDDTVRPAEKITGIGSGLKVAGKEFGLGLYDGISGLVTQPLKGAEKEGAAGLVKGVGKGIGGIMTKPAAGECSSCNMWMVLLI
jgi:hypothetical protein